jgi:hypothetical protein
MSDLDELRSSFNFSNNISTILETPEEIHKKLYQLKLENELYNAANKQSSFLTFMHYSSVQECNTLESLLVDYNIKIYNKKIKDLNVTYEKDNKFKCHYKIDWAKLK